MRRPGRLLTTALAFALAVLVMMVIQGFWGGLYATYTGLIRNTPVAFWVGQQGVKSVLNSSSRVPMSLAGEIGAIPGVESVTALHALPVIAEVNSRKVPFALFGYDLGSGLGGPWSLAMGREPAQSDEIVLDQAFAESNGLGVGDTLSLLGREWQIVGLSAGTNSFMSFALFADRVSVGRLAGMADFTSFLLVRTERGMSIEQVRSRLPSGYAVYTSEELVSSSEEVLSSIMGPVLQLFLGVSFLVGLAVIALTTYSSILERQGEYGVMRALGMPDSGLAAVVLTELMASAIVGLAVGSLLSAGAATLIAAALPAYPVVITAQAMRTTLLAGVLMGLLGAGYPVLRVTRMDPATVFRV